MRRQIQPNEQRDGRILRQGNQNDTVEVVRYVTEGSFDVYMWQTVELKAGFIHQVLGGHLGSRQIDDVASEQELSYAEVKALATGDDRIMRKAGLDADVARLRRQRSAHFEDQARLQRTISRGPERVRSLQLRAEALQACVAAMVDTSGDRFAMTVDDRQYRNRSEAGTHLVSLIDRAMHAASAGAGSDWPIAVLGGIGWHLTCTATLPTEAQLRIPDVGLSVTVTRADLPKLDPPRLAQRLEHLVAKLPTELADTTDSTDRVRSEITAAQSRLGAPFGPQADLDRLEAELAELNEDLARDTDPGGERHAPPQRVGGGLSR